MDLYFKYNNSKEEILGSKSSNNNEITQDSKLNLNKNFNKSIIKNKQTSFIIENSVINTGQFINNSNNYNNNNNNLTFEQKAEYLLSQHKISKDINKKVFFSKQHPHKLQYCNNSEKGYSSGWFCDICKKSFSDSYKSLHCKLCEWDICDDCFSLDIEYLE